jgi:AhpC/TSA family
MKPRVVLLAVALAVLDISLCAGQDSAEFIIPERTPAPKFTLPDLNGRIVSSESHPIADEALTTRPPRGALMRRMGIGSVLSLAALLALASGKRILALSVGDRAPDVALPATTQEKWSLSEILGKKNVVLFGFIGAFTPT